MKKRMLAILLMVSILLSLIPATNMNAYAESTTLLTKSSIGFTETSSITDVFTVTLTVKANKEAGLYNDIKVDFGELSCYGTLYIPGGVDTTKLAFYWDDPDIIIKKNGVVYNSGTAPVAKPGSTVTYSVTKGHSYATMTVKTLQGSGEVEPIFLNIDESLGTLDAMLSDKDHNTSCYGSAVFEGKSGYCVSMKGRGNSSWDKEKKPFNITFYKGNDFEKKKSVSLIDGVKSKKWSLIANYMDPTFLRNKISLNLAKRLGIGINSRYVDLFINGEYYGLYLLTPKYDYQVTDDGYLLECDNWYDNESYQFQLPGITDSGIDGKLNRMTVKDIGDDAIEAGVTNESIQEWFLKAWDALRDYDSEDYKKYFDIDSFAKMYLLYEFTKNYDVSCGSLLMHRDGTSEDDLLIAGPAWDLDLSNGWTLLKTGNTVGISQQFTAEGWYIDGIGLMVDDTTSLLQEFGKHADFMRRLTEIFNEYKWAFEEVLEDIDEQIDIIGDSAEMEEALWNGIHSYYYWVAVPTVIGAGKYQLNYRVTINREAYTDNLREYISKRLLWMSDHLYCEIPEGSISGNTTLNEFDTLSLKIILAAGNNENTFLWQVSNDGVNWENIDGGEESTLEIKVTKAQNGVQYRCIVTNAGTDIVNQHSPAVKTSAVNVFYSDIITVNEHVHNFVTTTVAPTCIEKGYTLSVCACGEFKKTDETEALQHSYVNGFCERCNEADPDVTIRIKTIPTHLKEGKLTMTLGFDKVGTFSFSQHDGGWCILNGDGLYIAVNRGELFLSKTPYVWYFVGNMFATDTRISISKIGKTFGITYKAIVYLSSDESGLKLSFTMGKTAMFYRSIPCLVK